MKTTRLSLFATVVAAILATSQPVLASGLPRIGPCKGGVEQRPEVGKRLLFTLSAPFRSAGWALYQLFRAPGRLAELIAFKEIGEQVASPVPVSPPPPWGQPL